MIFIDPTEARDNTRLPLPVLRASQVLPGLEALTGADLLISPHESPHIKSLPDPLPEPFRLAIEKHITSGLLVQRKTGRDLTSSIGKLDEILGRLLHWTHRPWLLVVADIKCDREGQAIVDGRPSNYTWAAVEGALAWWQLRGGMLTILEHDRLVAPWANGWLARLKKLSDSRYHHVSRQVQQVLLAPDCRDTLMSLPGIGPERAQALLESQGTLAWCLSYLSDPRSVDFAKIEGIGPKTIQSVRAWMGLKEGYVLSPMHVDDEEQKESKK